MSKEFSDKKLEKETASEKARQFGPLSLTAKEHYLIGSTPPQELIDNPEKDAIDLMSDEEVLDYLNKEAEQTKVLASLVGESSDLFKRTIKMHKATLAYLKKKSRLPEGF